MDANYVMDETLGTASFDIAKLEVGQTKMESFSIGKVSGLISFVDTDTRCEVQHCLRFCKNCFKLINGSLCKYVTRKCPVTLEFSIKNENFGKYSVNFTL